MKTSTYNDLKIKVNEMNKINDEISLIEWNNDDGPKFESVDEMKEFYRKLENNEFDYLFGIDEDISQQHNKFIEKFDFTLNDMFFFLYTYKKNDDYITYMSMKNLKDNDVLENLYGHKTNDEKVAHSYFEKLKNDITTNTLDYIIDNIIIDVDKNIKKLKTKYEELISEN